MGGFEVITYKDFFFYFSYDFFIFLLKTFFSDAFLFIFRIYSRAQKKMFFPSRFFLFFSFYIKKTVEPTFRESQQMDWKILSKTFLTFWILIKFSLAFAHQTSILNLRFPMVFFLFFFLLTVFRRMDRRPHRSRTRPKPNIN